MVTGQRRSEISNLEWTEIQNDRIEIGGQRSKNGKPITTPLTDVANTVLKTLQRNNGVYVFSTTAGHRPIGNFSQIKNILVEKSGVSGWTYHDFRRTMATTLETQGEIRANIMFALNHIDHSVTGIYERSDHFKAKHKCLSIWGSLLTE